MPIADLKERFSIPDSAIASAGSGLRLLTCQSGQSRFTGNFQLRITRARLTALLPPTLYPWQLDPPLPANVTIDQANHHRRTPPGWEILQRNGQTFITPPGQVHSVPTRHSLECCVRCTVASSPINLLDSSPRVLCGATTSRWTMACALEQAPARVPT